MKEIKRINLEGDTIYLKKNIFKEYKTIFPIKRNEGKKYFDKGNINYKHLFIGSWESFIKLIILIIFILFCLNAYNTDIENCREIIERDSAIIYYNSLEEDMHYSDIYFINISNIEQEKDIPST